MSRTAQQWLALGDVLGVELARILAPGPWRHAIKPRFSDSQWACRRCRKIGAYEELDRSFCPIPDPIKIDWASAMEWRDKTPDAAFQIAMLRVWDGIQDAKGGCIDAFARWAVNLTRPKDLLIAAAMAIGDKSGNVASPVEATE